MSKNILQKLSPQSTRYVFGVMSFSLTAIVVSSIIGSSIKTLAPLSSSLSSSSSISSSSSSSSTSVVPVIETYTVSFNPLAGTLSGNATVEVREGLSVLEYPSASLEDHEFIGWFTGTGPNAVLFTADMAVQQDTVLYARYDVLPEEEVLPEPITHLVAFEVDGGLPISSIIVDDKETIALPNTTKEGHKFLGWYTGYLPGDALFTSLTPITRDIVLYAKWEQNAYEISFAVNGGSTVDSIVAKPGELIQEPAQPTKYNHNFIGWSTQLMDPLLENEYHFDEMGDEDVTLYAQWALGSSVGLSYACDSNSCVVSDYDNSNGEVIIPALYNNLPVTGIGDSAFANATSVVRVGFEENSVITEIGKNAFNQATNLKAFALPDTLTTVRDSAFANLSSLQTLSLPASVTNVGVGILVGSDRIETLEYVSKSAYLANTPTYVKYFFGGNAYNASVTIPTSLKTIKLAEGSTVLPNDAMRDLTTIESVVIPNTVTTIGTNALSNMLALKNISLSTASLPTTNRYLRYIFGGTASGTGGVLPNALKNVNLTGGAEVYTSFFNTFTTVESVTLADTFVSVGVSAMNGMTALRDLTLNEGITLLDSNAFTGTTALTTVDLPSTLITLGASAFQNSGLTSVTLPQGLVTLGASAFQGATALTSASVPSSVTSWGTNVFYGTTALQTLSYSLESMPIASRFLRYAFGGTATTGGLLPTALKTVDVNGGTTLSTNYFYGFSTIETITLDNTITVIGSSAFYNTTSLVNFSLPTAVTEIQATAFSGSNKLTTLALPSTLVTIGNQAFLNMSALTEIAIPNSVTSMGTGILQATTALKKVEVSVASLPSNGKFLRFLFGGTAYNTGGTLPTSLENVKLTGGVEVSVNFFNSMTTIKTVQLDNSILAIQASAFNGLLNLTSVTLGNGVTSIGASAFAGTVALSSLSLPETLTTIDTNAFLNTGITQLTLPASITTLGASSLSSASLVSVTLLATSVPTGDNIFGVTPNSSLIVYVPAAAMDLYKVKFPTLDTAGKLQPIAE